VVNERKAVLAGIGVLTVALAGVLAIIYVRGQAPGSGPADEAAAKVEDEHDHGPLVVELLRTPVDVPAFSMTDLDGRTISSDSLKGKVVLINFWATWCGPCVVEIPDLVKLQAKYRDQLVVIGVSEDENGEALVRKFAADKKINYPLVMSTPELQALFPGVVALPTTFALDRNGKMVQKHVGLLHAEQTEALARVLSGLETDARVEHVDDANSLSEERIAEIKSVPGVNLERVAAERRPDVLRALNKESCSCGCGLTVAKCRVDDPSCPVSLPLAQSIADKYAVQ
jgi:thiol-disulfide isomerase/thioredoxin